MIVALSSAARIIDYNPNANTRRFASLRLTAIAREKNRSSIGKKIWKPNCPVNNYGLIGVRDN